MPRESFEKRRIVRRKRAPGELYKEIVVQRHIEEEEKDMLFRKKEPRYVRVCKKLHSIAPSLGAGADWPDDKFKDAIAFLNWDLSAEEFNASTKLILVGGMIIGVILGVLLLTIPFIANPLYDMLQGFAAIAAIGFFVSIAMAVFWYMQQYPFSCVMAEQRKALGYVPEIIGYIVMSMKLSPNLEKAAEFAAEHGRGKIADDFKKLLWDVELGMHNTLAEGLDEIAYTWGNYSTEFKRALMRVRASVLESSESKRDSLLNKTMEDLLSEIREKMETYARELKQPSIVLFYIGVLLPIILIIILPIGSAFTNAPFSTMFGLVGIYNIFIPAISFIYARSIIKHRPPTYDVPIIPDNYPGLPKKGTIKLRKGSVSIKAVVIAVIIFGLAFSWFLHVEGFPPKTLMFAIGGAEAVPILAPDQDYCEALEKASLPCDYFQVGGAEYKQIKRFNPRWDEARVKQELQLAEKKFMMEPGHDWTPFNLIFGCLITLAAVIYVWLYYANIYKRRIQEKIMIIETEFKDSLYIIASRLGENKPLEDAIKHAKNFLPNYVISDRIFGRTLDNIHLLGMPIDAAVFDPRFGSLVNIPSNLIRVGMRLVIDSVRLGVNIAARTLVSLSLQLDNQEKVSKMLKNLVVDLTQMMRTMAIIITPLVLGITTALYSVVVRTLIKISTSGAMDSGGTDMTGAESFGGFTTGNWAQPEAIASMVEPPIFILIIALYVIEIVFIVIYFTTKIEEDNDLLMKLYLAKYLPISIIMFTLSVMMSNLLLNSFAVIG